MNKHWLEIRLSILAISAFVLWKIIHYAVCDIKTTYCDFFTNFTSTFIEITVGIGIAIIVHNHSRVIEKRTDSDIRLTIQGTYYHLWSLYTLSIPFVISEKVRAEKIMLMQVFDLIKYAQINLYKCGQMISAKSIQDLQLHLIVIETTIGVLLDPRSDMEKYWKENGSKIQIALNQICEISRKDFESHVPEKQKMVWKNIE